MQRYSGCGMADLNENFRAMILEQKKSSESLKTMNFIYQHFPFLLTTGYQWFQEWILLDNRFVP